MGGQRTGRSGYAAARTFRHARLVQQSLRSWQTIAASSGRIAMSERKCQKLSLAVRISSITPSR
jgi:hypothetical protein